MDLTHIANTISHKDRRSRKTLLSCTRHIRHADVDDQEYHGPEEADDCITRHGRRGVVEPCAFPDHEAASDNGEAAEYKKDEADVTDTRGEVAGEENEDEHKGTERKLKEDGLEGCIAVVR